MSKLLGFLQSAVSLVLPAFGKVKALKGAGSGVFWALHAVVILAILAGLYYLNVAVLHWGRFIPGSNRFLADAWLSILFLLVYTLCWLSWWLFQLLAPEQEMTDFPDIDEAWAEAVAALNEAGVGLADAPLYLVIGQSEAKEEALFQAAQLKLLVKNVPSHPRAPLHVFANRDGIYVTCPGTSLLSEHATLLTGDPESPAVAAAGGGGGEDALDQTLRPSTGGGGAMKAAGILAGAQRKNRSITPEEQRELRRLARKERKLPSLLKNAEEVETQAARLEHLCRLIVRDRWPFCPANGILLLLPYAGSDNDQVALDTGDICQRDLMIARKALKVHCPLFAVVCDMETAPGFPEFLDRFTEAERQQRMGQRCPLVPALRGRGATAQLAPSPDESYGAMLDTVSRWICTSLVPGWVHKKFRMEGTGKAATVEEAVHGNARLFLLLDDLRERQSRLTTILTHGLETHNEPAWLFGGCYLAATGGDGGREQGFVAGVFRRLAEEQNYVSWTRAALEEEDLYQRWVGRGYVAVGLLGIAAVGLAVYLFLGPKK